MLEKIKDVLVDAINVDRELVKPEANLSEDLDIDSLAAVELVLELETEFDIRIEDEELANLKTVQDIMDSIASKQKEEENQMDTKKIREIVEIFENSQISRMDVEQDSFKIRLEKKEVITVSNAVVTKKERRTREKDIEFSFSGNILCRNQTRREASCTSGTKSKNRRCHLYY